MQLFSLILSVFILVTCNSLHAENKAETPSGRGYIIQLETTPAPAVAANYDELTCRHVFMIAWNGKSADNLKYARQMGYKRLAYRKGMENVPEAADMYFILESPESNAIKKLGAENQVVIKKDYSKEVQEMYKNFFSLRNANAPFPLCMATGWPVPARGPEATVSFAPMPDYQQQRVHTYFIDTIFDVAKKIERPEKNFLFGGVAWDVPDLCGDFWELNNRLDKKDKNFANKAMPLNVKSAEEKEKDKATTTCLVNDCGDVYPGTTHEYSTYKDGKAAYLIAIKKRAGNDFKGRPMTFMIEPWLIYDQWVKQIENRKDCRELMENLIVVQECHAWSGKREMTTRFADDPMNFKSGIVTRDWVGSTQPNDHGFDIVKEIAGKAGANGSWFGWFGRFDETGYGTPEAEAKKIKNVYQIPRWEQLTREVASWDNLNGVPLDQRNWNGKEYVSANSKISDDVIYSRQPKTRKLFAVFMNSSGSIPLKPGEKVIAIKKVDDFFCEQEDGSADLNVSDNKITIRQP